MAGQRPGPDLEAIIVHAKAIKILGFGLVLRQFSDIGRGVDQIRIVQGGFNPLRHKPIG
jgi:hypothetical protein